MEDGLSSIILSYVLKRNYDLSLSLSYNARLSDNGAVMIKEIHKNDCALRESRVQLQLKPRVYK